MQKTYGLFTTFKYPDRHILKNSRLEYIIPTVLALVITIVLILSMPVLTTKYLIEEIDSDSVNPDEYDYYYDLDGDGNSEIISIYLNSSNNLAVNISEIKKTTINQFNLPGELTTQSDVLDIHDINRDGIEDIFVCTQKDDNLYLSIIDDMFGHPTRTREYLVDKLNTYNDNGDYLFSSGGLTDLNQDGFPEYVFCINGGHALHPRKVYAIDYRNDSLWQSPLSGAAVVGLDFFDMDNDGSDEILLNTVAPENYKSPVPYSDSVSWLMVLDPVLQYYKPPIMMSMAPSWINLKPFIHDSTRYLLAYHRYRGSGEDISRLSIYNDSLKPVNTRYFQGFENTPSQIWRGVNGYELEDIKVLKGNGIYTLDFELQFVDSVFNKAAFGYAGETRLDIDQDGKLEYITLEHNRISVYRNDYTESAGMDIRWDGRRPKILISMIEKANVYPTFVVQVGVSKYEFRYYKNKWVHYREFVYPGIFILLFGLFYLWVLVQNKILARRYEKDRLISRLQLQSIKNQLDPHFTYNALNAVGSLIYKGEKDLAYQYLRGLTDLLRMVSGDSADITWTLSQEMEFVLKYLEIEKLRFREKFNYQLKVDEDRLKNLSVPKMCILTFVENSIKHGLRHKEYDRQLEVSVTGFEKGLRIAIRDNGIGRAAAARHQGESAGNGIEMMKQYLKQFSEATGKKARFRVEDLFEYDLKAAGTLVEITII